MMVLIQDFCLWKIIITLIFQNKKPNQNNECSFDSKDDTGVPPFKFLNMMCQ